jgi:hypothetical protein
MGEAASGGAINRPPRHARLAERSLAWLTMVVFSDRTRIDAHTTRRAGALKAFLLHPLSPEVCGQPAHVRENVQ